MPELVPSLSQNNVDLTWTMFRLGMVGSWCLLLPQALCAMTWGISWYLRVGSFDEFSAKMKVLVPQKMKPVQEWIQTIDLPKPHSFRWRPFWMDQCENTAPTGKIPTGHTKTSSANVDPNSYSRRYGYYEHPS